jgi:hypothetical protein
VLPRRHARWAEILSSYSFINQHLEGKENPADKPSRRPDYEEGCKRPNAPFVATLTGTTVEPFSDLLPRIGADQDTDPLATDMRNTISQPDGSKNVGQDGSEY